MMAHRRMRVAWPLLVILLLLAAACERFPQDPERSLDTVLETDTIRIGLANSPPWVIHSDEEDPRGAEVALLSEFATELGVGIRWEGGSSEGLLEALTRYELDIVAGGLTDPNPWSAHVGFTLPYHTSWFVVASPEPGSGLGSLEGRTVAVRPGTGLTRALERRGARLLTAENPAEVADLMAGNSWEVVGQGWYPTDQRLQEFRHVFAVPPGENGLLMRLESFLREHADSGRVVDLLLQADDQ